MVEFIIRKSVKEDCSAILDLIQELADYEKMSNGPKLKLETFVEDGFGKEAFYKCLVAEANDENSDDKKIVGYSLYYFTYSTWEGKSIYMEDLYVTPKFRHNGIGESLWKAVVKAGLEKGCCRTDFTVLAWNTPSIEFYLKKGAYDLTTKEEWHLFRMNKDEMNKFCNA
ncbi:UNVERIFIED_CONTAM: hypothetical protein RMT77_012016 [Armadillidium vulgare]|nr:Diamine acetyltransferase 2 [Armadillidium vulgare]